MVMDRYCIGVNILFVILYYGVTTGKNLMKNIQDLFKLCPIITYESMMISKEKKQTLWIQGGI